MKFSKTALVSYSVEYVFKFGDFQALRFEEAFFLIRFSVI